MGVMRTLTLNGVTYAVESSVPTANTVTLKAADWLGDTSPYSQIVAIDGVTSRTKVDLQPTMDQVDVMYSQSVGFFTVNEGGVVRAQAVGKKPTENFTFQITLTEVEGDVARIKGNTVGFPNPQPDWNQNDHTQADYIKNKPDMQELLPVAGGNMTGTLTTCGITLTHGVDYGDELPPAGTPGRLFFKKVNV